MFIAFIRDTNQMRLETIILPTLIFRFFGLLIHHEKRKYVFGLKVQIVFERKMTLNTVSFLCITAREIEA